MYKNFSHKAVLLICLFMIHDVSSAQIIDLRSLPTCSLDSMLKINLGNKDFDTRIITDYSAFPSLDKFKGEHIYSLPDSTFGDIPFKLFIPDGYDASRPTPLILLLHGGVGGSKFSDANLNDPSSEMETDPFYKKLCQLGYVIVMPYADTEKGFNWVANKFGTDSNATFGSLVRILTNLKRSINIDDDKIFAFGHSDGSDGAFALDVYEPGIFAGFVSYNSMLNVLFAHDFYIGNSVDRPLYLVHSDKDDLRPIQQTREIVKILDSLGTAVKYKEYFGYKHFDKHLDIDFPNSVNFIANTTRNPYPKFVHWETSDHLYERCDWLSIKTWDLTLPRAAWHKTKNLDSYDKINRTWLKLAYYYRLNESAAIEGKYEDNTFEVKTSRVTGFEILISPRMVDLNKPVRVVVNGKTKFSGTVRPDQKFFYQQFLATRDRCSIWVNSITVNVPNGN